MEIQPNRVYHVDPKNIKTNEERTIAGIANVVITDINETGEAAKRHDNLSDDLDMNKGHVYVKKFKESAFDPPILEKVKMKYDIESGKLEKLSYQKTKELGSEHYYYTKSEKEQTFHTEKGKDGEIGVYSRRSYSYGKEHCTDNKEIVRVNPDGTYDYTLKQGLMAKLTDWKMGNEHLTSILTAGLTGAVAGGLAMLTGIAPLAVGAAIVGTAVGHSAASSDRYRQEYSRSEVALGVASKAIKYLSYAGTGAMAVGFLAASATGTLPGTVLGLVVGAIGGATNAFREDYLR